MGRRLSGCFGGAHSSIGVLLQYAHARLWTLLEKFEAKYHRRPSMDGLDAQVDLPETVPLGRHSH